MVATARSSVSRGGISSRGDGSHGGGSHGGGSHGGGSKAGRSSTASFLPGAAGGGAKRRSSKVYEPDLGAADESLLSEIDASPAPWTWKSLFGPRRKGQPPPPPERFIVAHLAEHKRFVPDPRWWDTHGVDLPLGGDDKRQLMVRGVRAVVARGWFLEDDNDIKGVMLGRLRIRGQCFCAHLLWFTSLLYNSPGSPHHVLRYGMRVPFPVETVYRWFEEILELLRLRAKDMLTHSVWRLWPAPSLVVLLREHAWSNDAKQKLLHTVRLTGCFRTALHSFLVCYLDDVLHLSESQSFSRILMELARACASYPLIRSFPLKLLLSPHCLSRRRPRAWTSSCHWPTAGGCGPSTRSPAGGRRGARWSPTPRPSSPAAALSPRGGRVIPGRQLPAVRRPPAMATRRSSPRSSGGARPPVREAWVAACSAGGA